MSDTLATRVRSRLLLMAGVCLIVAGRTATNVVSAASAVGVLAVDETADAITPGR